VISVCTLGGRIWLRSGNGGDADQNGRWLGVGVPVAEQAGDFLIAWIDNQVPDRCPSAPSGFKWNHLDGLCLSSPLHHAYGFLTGVPPSGSIERSVAVTLADFFAHAAYIWTSSLISPWVAP